ncbi:hypothetical protein C8F04DRAFT_474195 [Mycena alexandri]|uniref:Uncharacterized protein n=1 Tax=Mycena alexandri TaxID=1745969 RepID=A0AAD6T3E4_9AGAR|nr:hypothetical protein C8F04DRAFT_474195 [Mycena alexandri]
MDGGTKFEKLSATPVVLPPPPRSSESTNQTSTLLIHALFSIMTFLLRPVFVFRRRSRSAASTSTSTRGAGELHAPVTPYPLAPHRYLEGRVLDIGVGARDASISIGPVHSAEGTPSKSRSRRHQDVFRCVDDTRLPLPTTPKQQQDAMPLGVVTNFARVRGARRQSLPTPSEGRGAENGMQSETPPKKKEKESPRRRMPRCLNLARTSPGVKKHAASSPGSPTKGVSCGSPGGSPAALASCVAADEAVDWAARIRSVFYNRKWDGEDDDLPESIREFFTRDSVGSDEHEHERSVGSSTKGEDSEGCEHDADAEDDYGRPLSVRSTCYSPSRADSSPESESLATPTHPHAHLQLSGVPSSSELAYLGGDASELSASSSGASGAFNDLLASVDRKYPGRHWPEIIQFSGCSEDGHGHGHGGRGGRTCGGNNGGNGLQQCQWSDVFCLDEYAS